MLFPFNEMLTLTLAPLLTAIKVVTVEVPFVPKLFVFIPPVLVSKDVLLESETEAENNRVAPLDTVPTPLVLPFHPYVCEYDTVGIIGLESQFPAAPM